MSAKNITCRLCAEQAHLLFKTLVLRKYDVGYYECGRCRLIQTEDPYWLEEAYARPINAEDTGLLVRNTTFADRVSVLLFSLLGPQGRYLDYAGGYGVFTRMMRDKGFDYCWTDRYTQNLLAKGFEHKPDERIDALTAFEVLEHFVNPVDELRKMSAISDVLIVSTELAPERTPAAGEWWYYGHEHGQHIAFFRQSSLQELAKRLGLRCWSNGRNLHLLAKGEFVPYCLREKDFVAINRQSGIALDHAYRRVTRRGKDGSQLKLLGEALRGRTYRMLRDDVEKSTRARIASNVVLAPAFSDYVCYLLQDNLDSWDKLLRSRLESRTFADMLLIIQEGVAGP